MAEIYCSHNFYGAFRKPEEPVYDAAFNDLRSLSSEGIIEGPFALSVGDRQDSADVFVSIWRLERVVPDKGWSYDGDTDPYGNLPHRYTRRFNPAAVAPDEIVHAFKQFLFCPCVGGPRCTECGEPIGGRGESRMVASEAHLVRMAPFCERHLSEFDARRGGAR